MKSAIAFALSKLRRPPQEREGFARERPMTVIPVLVASQRDGDFQRIRESLDRSRWLVAEARDWSTAVRLCEYMIFPVVVCDREFPDLDGHTTVDAFAGAWGTAAVVWLSDRWDPDFWESLQEQGGFDVLMRPLHADDVPVVLEAAYRNWVARPSTAMSTESPRRESSRRTLARSRTAS